MNLIAITTFLILILGCISPKGGSNENTGEQKNQVIRQRIPFGKINIGEFEKKANTPHPGGIGAETEIIPVDIGQFYQRNRNKHGDLDEDKFIKKAEGNHPGGLGGYFKRANEKPFANGKMNPVGVNGKPIVVPKEREYVNPYVVESDDDLHYKPGKVKKDVAQQPPENILPNPFYKDLPITYNHPMREDKFVPPENILPESLYNNLPIIYKHPVREDKFVPPKSDKNQAGYRGFTDKKTNNRAIVDPYKIEEDILLGKNPVVNGDLPSTNTDKKKEEQKKPVDPYIFQSFGNVFPFGIKGNFGLKYFNNPPYINPNPNIQTGPQKTTGEIGPNKLSETDQKPDIKQGERNVPKIEEQPVIIKNENIEPKREDSPKATNKAIDGSLRKSGFQDKIMKESPSSKSLIDLTISQPIQIPPEDIIPKQVIQPIIDNSEEPEVIQVLTGPTINQGITEFVKPQVKEEIIEPVIEEVVTDLNKPIIKEEIQKPLINPVIIETEEEEIIDEINNPNNDPLSQQRPQPQTFEEFLRNHLKQPGPLMITEGKANSDDIESSNEISIINGQGGNDVEEELIQNEEVQKPIDLVKHEPSVIEEKEIPNLTISKNPSILIHSPGLIPEIEEINSPSTIEKERLKNIPELILHPVNTIPKIKVNEDEHLIDGIPENSLIEDEKNKINLPTIVIDDGIVNPTTDSNDLTGDIDSEIPKELIKEPKDVEKIAVVGDESQVKPEGSQTLKLPPLKDDDNPAPLGKRKKLVRSKSLVWPDIPKVEDPTSKRFYDDSDISFILNTDLEEAHIHMDDILKRATIKIGPKLIIDRDHLPSQIINQELQKVVQRITNVYMIEVMGCKKCLDDRFLSIMESQAR